MPLKILLLNKLYYPHIGGVEKVVKDIADGLKGVFSFKVLVANKKGKTKKEKVNGIDVIRTQGFGIFFSMPISLIYPIYMKVLSRWADILHIHLPFPLGVLSYLIVKPSPPLIVTWHSDIVRQKTFLFFYRWFLFKFLEKAHTIVATSYELSYSSSFLRYFLDKTRVVPIGTKIRKTHIDTSHLRDLYGDRVVLFVGRFVYYKGIFHLLSAMEKVNGKCILIGDGPLKGKIQSYIKEHNISHKVYIVSNVGDDELYVYYRISSLFVLPSIYKSEAYGIVLLEALSNNVPIVTFDLPTGVSFINDGRYRGIRVLLKEKYRLASTINFLLDHPKIKKKMGKRGKKWIEKITYPEEKYKDIYENISI